MAENKKSFILYCDIIHTLEKLSDEDAGKLFKHILRYVNDLNPTTDHAITEIAFEPIKQQLKRDLIKYEKLVKRNIENAKKGANARWNRTAPKNADGHPTASKDAKRHPKMPVNDNDIDNVIVNDINKRKEIFKEKLNAYANEYGNRLIYDFFLY
jgi:hypothetical protein